MATDAYSLIDSNFLATMAQIQSQRNAGDLSRQNKERQLATGLTETQRGLNIGYKNEVNPFGRNAEQRGVMGQGVSEYFKNAAYGHLLQGLGKTQQDYQENKNVVSSEWDNFVARMAGLETQATTEKNNAYLSQQAADEEAAFRKQQFAYQMEQDALANQTATGGTVSGGGTGITGTGGLNLTGNTAIETAAERAARLNSSSGVRKTNYVPRTPLPTKSYNYSPNGYLPRSSVK